MNNDSNTIKQLKTRLKMSNTQLGEYLGVSAHLIRKIITCERSISPILARLIYTLGVVETLAPSVHESLIKKG